MSGVKSNLWFERRPHNMHRYSTSGKVTSRMTELYSARPSREPTSSNCTQKAGTQAGKATQQSELVGARSTMRDRVT